MKIPPKDNRNWVQRAWERWISQEWRQEHVLFGCAGS